METSNDLFELHVDQNGSSFLREIAKWSKFLSIVGFVMMGLVLLVAAFAFTAESTIFSGSTFGRTNTFSSSGGGAFFQFLILFAFMLIYLVPCIYLFKFSTKMQSALRNNDQETLNASFENLKSCFKFMGILTIVILSIYALAFLGIMVTVGAYS